MPILVISVVASAISKEFVGLHLGGRGPLAKTPSVKTSRRDVKKLEEANSEENEYTLFNQYAYIDSQSPYLVTLHVDGVLLQIEIDTGSSLSLYIGI